ncbi:ABC transporter ATP-binding protein [Rhodococcus kronopolitis]|uniref:ATP-binding cassette domain-containing protein n=1 Tax=Rhodococcus kronopolitis TaxID=1460226 RepID=A0ABV9FUB2_9NOCA
MLDHSHHDDQFLVVRDAARHFGELTAFARVNFGVAAGNCCAIIGDNGAGKSTLLQCVIGADRLNAGSITIDGADVDESSPRFRATVAAVVGDVATFAHLTAHEHLQLVATAHGVPDPYAIATATLSDVGLAGAADQLPVTLSSGQRRRLALASAFVRPRRLLVLDEPEQHLDSAGRSWLASALEQEKRMGTAVLLVSHDSDLVAAVADHVVEAGTWH